MIIFNPVILESKPFSELIEQSEYVTFEKKEIIVQSNKICNYLYLVETDWASLAPEDTFSKRFEIANWK